MTYVLLLILCKITNENLLSSAGNSAVTCMGRQPKKEGTYVYLKLIHFAVQQKLTTLEGSYTPVKNFFKKAVGRTNKMRELEAKATFILFKTPQHFDCY